jgi:hypothetical protein
MIDDRTIHGAQDPVGHVGGPGNLKKMVAAVFQFKFWQGNKFPNTLANPPPPSRLHPEITVVPWLRLGPQESNKNHPAGMCCAPRISARLGESLVSGQRKKFDELWWRDQVAQDSGSFMVWTGFKLLVAYRLPHFSHLFIDDFPALAAASIDLKGRERVKTKLILVHHTPK